MESKGEREIKILLASSALVPGKAAIPIAQSEAYWK
jgi:hypothetical protein